MGGGKYKALASVVGLFAATVAVSALLFQPRVRSYSQELIYSSNRDILSVVQAELMGMSFKFIKLRVGNVVFIEAYEDQGGGTVNLLDRVQLTDSKDAFFRTEDGRTNLFLQDIDDDEVPEVLSPSFDKNMMSHLNIYKFDVLSKTLRPLTKH